jgi:hypothetical protein
VARREYRLKLTPSGVGVAPSGALWPSIVMGWLSSIPHGFVQGEVRGILAP